MQQLNYVCLCTMYVLACAMFILINLPTLNCIINWICILVIFLIWSDRPTSWWSLKIHFWAAVVSQSGQNLFGFANGIFYHYNLTKYFQIFHCLKLKWSKYILCKIGGIWKFVQANLERFWPRCVVVRKSSVARWIFDGHQPHTVLFGSTWIWCLLCPCTV
jgi:hypothetical protein